MVPPSESGAPLSALDGIPGGDAEGSARSRRRYRGIASGAAASFANRVIGIAVTLAVVPLTIRYLGSERYGVWMTISSVLGWLQLADLGVSNSLTNVLSAAHARGDERDARGYVSSGFFLLACVGAVMAVTGLLSSGALDWGGIFRVADPAVRDETAGALAAAVALFAVALPLLVTDRVYFSSQEGAISSRWSASASILTLLAVYVAARLHAGLLGLVLAFAGVRVLVSCASTAWLFTVHRPMLRPSPRCVDKSRMRVLARTGGVFLVIQAAALVLYNTDNLVIATILGAERVTPYAVAWKLFSVPSLAISLVFPYLWPAYAEALVRGDAEWVARTLRWSVGMAGAVAVIVAGGLLVVGERIIEVWAGRAAVAPFSVMVWMAAWTVLNAVMNAVVCLINAAGRIRNQAIYGSLMAIANLALSVWWGKRFGLTGVMAGTVVSYVVISVAPSLIDLRLLLRELEERRAGGAVRVGR